MSSWLNIYKRLFSWTAKLLSILALWAYISAGPLYSITLVSWMSEDKLLNFCRVMKINFQAQNRFSESPWGEILLRLLYALCNILMLFLRKMLLKHLQKQRNLVLFFVTSKPPILLASFKNSNNQILTADYLMH